MDQKGMRARPCSGCCLGGSGSPLLALSLIYSQNSVHMFSALFFTCYYFKI